jgi:hypothetical protein
LVRCFFNLELLQRAFSSACGPTVYSRPHIFARKAEENFFIHRFEKYISILAISNPRRALKRFPSTSRASWYNDFAALSGSFESK